MIKNIKIYIKTIFLIFLCTSVNSKDLTGNTLGCVHEQKAMKWFHFFAINFINSNELKYSSIFIDQYDPNDEIVKKTNDIYKYKVNEDNIVILNKNERKGIPYDHLINRKTLMLKFDPLMKGAKCNLKHYKKVKSFIEDYQIPVKKDPKNIL
jgi:hypothetical protein